MLFLLVAEIIAIHIRSDNNIKVKGVDINNPIYKISLMADDTTLIIKNPKSLSTAIEHFQLFKTCSELKLNLNKTEIIHIGTNTDKTIISIVYKFKKDHLRLWRCGSQMTRMKQLH